MWRFLKSCLVCGVIGVTLASPAFLPMIEHTVGRFIANTHVPVITMSPIHDRSWCAKLELDKLPYQQSIVFFDADLFFVRKVDLSQFDNAECIFGVHDWGADHPRHFCYHDSGYFGINRSLYINTGFFIWNNRLAKHREIFEMARQLYEEEGALKRTTGQQRVLDWGEQSYLNAAIQRLQIEVRLLPCEWNYFFIAETNNHSEYPRRSGPVNALHAAGYKTVKKKIEAALAFEKVLRRPVLTKSKLWPAKHI